MEEKRELRLTWETEKFSNRRERQRWEKKTEEKKTDIEEKVRAGKKREKITNEREIYQMGWKYIR